MRLYHCLCFWVVLKLPVSTFLACYLDLHYDYIFGKTKVELLFNLLLAGPLHSHSMFLSHSASTTS